MLARMYRIGNMYFALPGRFAHLIEYGVTRWITRAVFGVAIFAVVLPRLALREAQADFAAYRLTFQSSWSSKTHPTDFPSNPHFSPLIGMTHAEGGSFWQPGQLASPGVKAVAELGATGVLREEIVEAQLVGAADSLIAGEGISRSPGVVETTFMVDESSPYASVISMIAPSPDWFVGTHGVALWERGEWLPRLEVELWPYDAGTDSGASYTSANRATLPAQPIQLLTGSPFNQPSSLGTLTFLRLLEGDFNENGELGPADIELLSAAVRENDYRVEWDLNGDGTLSQQDRLVWIETLAMSYVGDSNWDGEFGTRDLATVFQAGEFEDDVAMNSSWATGDWDGNGDFQTGDLVLALQRGGFEAGPRMSAQAVPEPSGLEWWLLAAGMLSLQSRLSVRATGVDRQRHATSCIKPQDRIPS